VFVWDWVCGGAVVTVLFCLVVFVGLVVWLMAAPKEEDSQSQENSAKTAAKAAGVKRKVATSGNSVHWTMKARINDARAHKAGVP
jgi:hypothetical protein